MFDSLKNLAGLAGIMKDMPRIKRRLEEIKQKLGRQTVTAERGGGVVRATVTGLMQVVSIEAEPALLARLVKSGSENDRAAAQDLIVEALNAALELARALAEREFNAAAAELGLPLPPGALNGLLR